MSLESHAPLSILHIDADAGYARLVRDSLAACAAAPPRMTQVASLSEAVALLREQPFDVLLAEVPPGDDQGHAAIKLLLRAAGHTPVVALSSQESGSGQEGGPRQNGGSPERETLALAALELGVQDFLFKEQTDGPALHRALLFARERVARGLLPSREVAARRTAPLRMLAVEDDMGDLLLLEEALSGLQGEGAELLYAARLSEALDQLRARPFGLVLLDLSLPDGRGLGSFDAIRREAPDPPCVVYTASGDEGLALLAIRRGAADFLIKGETDRRLLERSIRFALRRHWPTAASSDAGLATAAQETSGLSFHTGAMDLRRGERAPPRGEPARELASPTRTGDRRERVEAAPDPERRGAVFERRATPRYNLVRSALVIPVGADGGPDGAEQIPGATCDLSAGGIGMEMETDRLPSAKMFVVGVAGRNDEFYYAGLQLCHAERLGPRRWRVGGKFGGLGEKLLSADTLTPTIDPASMRLAWGMPEEVLRAWSEIGVLRPVLLDWIDLCGKCQGLPTIRTGCRSCGSGRVTSARLIHHFACALVAPVAEFERGGELVCPKCRVRRLVVGSDFEYQTGLHNCLDCHWSGSDPELVCQCLRCGNRFPRRLAQSMEMIGYHVQRLDPLALIAAP